MALCRGAAAEACRSLRVLIGSTALQKYLPDINPRDVDYFSQKPVQGAETFYHPDLEKWDWADVATLDELMTIKLSHIFWELKNGSWIKHFYYLTIMQDAGAKFLPGLYDILYPIWEERYGKKKANLSQNAEEFFSSSVTRVYEHDSIHESIADEPMFRKILKDGAEVAVDKRKFFELTYEDQLKTVREELYATALEREIIPSDYRTHHKRAYMNSLQKMLTSYSKGWFALFVAQNANVLRSPETNYVELHLNNKDRLVKIDH